MKTTKKSQINQVFIYLISALIIIFVLYYGYTAIIGFSSKQQQIAYATFKAELEKAISGVATDFGTVRIQDIDAPPNYNQVCFVDPSLIGNPGSDAAALQSTSPIMYDSVSSGARNDVFLLPSGSPFYEDNVQVSGPNNQKFFCTDIKYGKVKLRFEGLGNAAKISIP